MGRAGLVGTDDRHRLDHFDVVRHKTRCLATHANPRTGERDLPLMTTLVKAFGQKEPTFAVGIVTRGSGGEIRLGDDVSVVD